MWYMNEGAPNLTFAPTAGDIDSDPPFFWITALPTKGWLGLDVEGVWYNLSGQTLPISLEALPSGHDFPPLDYRPMTTTINGIDSFYVALKDTLNWHQYNPILLRVTINAVNNAPVISGTSFANVTYNSTASNGTTLNITDVAFTDDGSEGAHSGCSYTFNMTAVGSAYIGFSSESIGNRCDWVKTPTYIGFRSNINIINNLLLSTGILFRPDGSTADGKLYITINDGGNKGSGGALQTTKTININVTTVV